MTESMQTLTPVEELCAFLVGRQYKPAGIIVVGNNRELAEEDVAGLGVHARVMNGKVGALGIAMEDDVLTELDAAWTANNTQRVGKVLGYPDVLIDAYTQGAKRTPRSLWKEAHGMPVPSWMRFNPFMYVTSLNEQEQMDAAAFLGQRYEMVTRKEHPELAATIDKQFP